MPPYFKKESDTDKISVLYVDDEIDLLTICTAFLQRDSAIEVDTSISVTEAIEKIRTGKYDIIVSDYLMPGKNGIDLLRDVRSTFGEIPFILFTGKGREDVVIQAINNGADFYLQKGSDITSQYSELLHMIHQAVEKQRAKEALEKTIDQLHHAEKIAGLGYWTFHLDDNTISASQGARSIYGVEEREWTIPEAQQMVLPDFRQYLDDAMKNLIREGKPYNVEFTIKHQDTGENIDICAIAEYDPLKNQVFGTIQDITRIKEAEKELRKKNRYLQEACGRSSTSEDELYTDTDNRATRNQQIREKEDRLRILSDNFPNGFVYQVIMTPDGNRHFEYISAGVRKIHGVSADDALNDPSVLYNQFIEEDLPRVINAEEQAYKNMTAFMIEARIRPVDGQIRWILLRSIPRKKPDGVILWDGIAIDITDQKKAEEALLEINELFTQFVKHSPIYTYIKTVTPTESRVLYASENFIDMVGIPGSEMVGKSMDELFHPVFAAKMTMDDWNVVSQGDVLKIAEDLKGRNYISIKYPIIQQNRTLLAGYTIDITDLKQAEEALYIANQKLRLLSGLTRHDIFNQISVVQGFQELIEESSELSEVHTYIIQAQKACEQIIATIGFTREFEDFGTALSGWQRLFSIIESAKAEVNFSSIIVENAIPVDLEIYADPIIRKVFTTFFENAIRHGERITVIRFSCHYDEHTLVISYEDNGIGIPDGDKVRIFNHGYGKHTGIGLFLAREILSINGFSIRECGKLEKGARFEIHVPAGKYTRTRTPGSPTSG